MGIITLFILVGCNTPSEGYNRFCEEKGYESLSFCDYEGEMCFDEGVHKIMCETFYRWNFTTHTSEVYTVNCSWDKLYCKDINKVGNCEKYEKQFNCVEISE